jgi:hypothetical protein
MPTADPDPSAPTPSQGRRRARGQFLLALFAVCSLVGALGWWSGLRSAFRGMLLALSVATFLPLLLIVAFVVVFLGLSLVAILSGDADATPHAGDAFGAAEGLRAFVRRVLVPYYRLLFVRRHPLFLGALGGLFLGTLLLGALLVIRVLPGEVCTLKRMAAVQSAVEDHYRHRAGYPPPVQAGWVDARLAADAPGGWPYCSIGSEAAEGVERVVLDGFGRKLRYEVAGRWPLASYRILSLGYDGRDGRDDLCLSGSSRARAALDRLATAAGAIHDLLATSSAHPGQHRWWSVLRAATCPPEARSTD